MGIVFTDRKSKKKVNLSHSGFIYVQQFFYSLAFDDLTIEEIQEKYTDFNFLNSLKEQKKEGSNVFSIIFALYKEKDTIKSDDIKKLISMINLEMLDKKSLSAFGLNFQDNIIIKPFIDLLNEANLNNSCIDYA